MTDSNKLKSKQFLAASKFCDYQEPVIQNLVGEIGGLSENPREKAINCFFYVRDEIVFGMDPWQIKASETLQKGYGMCSNKALLLVAQLRCLGIPSRLAWVPLNRHFLKPAWGFPWTYCLPRALKHVIAQVFLDQKWIALDLTLDKTTYERLYKPAGAKWGIDWNGEDDCLVFQDHLTGQVEPFSDIDSALLKDAGNWTPPALISQPFLKKMNRITWKKAGIVL
ncbi:MAG: transglutaminase family protein [Thermodesulfobacteriota bacterium]